MAPYLAQHTSLCVILSSAVDKGARMAKPAPAPKPSMDVFMANGGTQLMIPSLHPKSIPHAHKEGAFPAGIPPRRVGTRARQTHEFLRWSRRDAFR